MVTGFIKGLFSEGPYPRPFPARRARPSTGTARRALAPASLRGVDCAGSPEMRPSTWPRRPSGSGGREGRCPARVDVLDRAPDPVKLKEHPLMNTVRKLYESDQTGTIHVDVPVGAP